MRRRSEHQQPETCWHPDVIHIRLADHILLCVQEQEPQADSVPEWVQSRLGKTVWCVQTDHICCYVAAVRSSDTDRETHRVHVLLSEHIWVSLCAEAVRRRYEKLSV